MNGNDVVSQNPDAIARRLLLDSVLFSVTVINALRLYTMTIRWVLVLAALTIACASSERGNRGSSLRGALEALQRRQRGRNHGSIVPQPDYDAVYEFVPPQTYPDPDYGVDVEENEDEPTPKYVVKLLSEDQRPLEDYEYKIIKKKNAYFDSPDYASKKESAFRERSQHTDSDTLRDIFTDSNELGDRNDFMQERTENDADYVQLLDQLWSKYKHNKNKLHSNNIDTPHGVVKLYKEKNVKKRYPNNWGPIAFKKKRNSDFEENDDNYNAYKLADTDKDDTHAHIMSFQPMDDDGLSGIIDEDQYEAIEKRFPVSKRSSGPYYSSQKKSFTLEQNKREISKNRRSNLGTDPKVLKDLSKIFGEGDSGFIKTPVKRSSDHDKASHEMLPPNLTILAQNSTFEFNNTQLDKDRHEHRGGAIHHPGLSGEKIEQDADHDHHIDHAHDQDHAHDHTLEHNDHDHSKDHIHIHDDEHSQHSYDHDHEQKHIHDHSHSDQDETEKPITLKKKSIDWSDYFGIDKRLKNSESFVNDLNQDKLKTQYYHTFNKEVINPVNNLQKHVDVKRNFILPNPIPGGKIKIKHIQTIAFRNNNKRNNASDNDTNSNLDYIDKNLRNMEGLIVNDAIHITKDGEKLDSKEEQEIKEKLLSRLSAAYSLEKMRKALKEFKQNLRTEEAINMKLDTDNEELKPKRVAEKKERAIPTTKDVSNYIKEGDKNDDFEDEQGAGHYLNGKIEEQLSEGYMGGSGRHRTPMVSTVSSTGPCPVLAKIIQRCRGVDLLAGDRGQLFLPHCSLHQICYLCGEAPPTTCDLVFLSEADTTCEGDMSCQRAARSTLMTLRELHDNLADELDGECEASPCLPATLKLNIGWQRALQR
ncbi:unnamed protein product [Parnassius apollo]|uniref:(apollo) hypothetical protein n=1 Tax=Parnassius apollo TaxID=110799 RepID=A0A8S3WRH1_PARAO|nr:unnamed protein product [Parnassius apollo]